MLTGQTPVNPTWLYWYGATRPRISMKYGSVALRNKPTMRPFLVLSISRHMSTAVGDVAPQRPVRSSHGASAGGGVVVVGVVGTGVVVRAGNVNRSSYMQCSPRLKWHVQQDD
jgi:hypothetical protein